MAERFPTTPRAPLAVRIAAVLLTLAAALLAARTIVTSARWVGRVFPGFMLLDNRVVASVGLAHWPGSQVDRLYQSEVVSVDGAPVVSRADVYARVAALAPGTPVRYGLRRDGAERIVTIPAESFTGRDWALFFGSFLFSAAAYLASGLAVWLLRPRLAAARALAALGVGWCFFMLTSMDLYGPSTFFRLHVACETAVPPALLALALLFPQPHPLARWRLAGYVPALAILAAYETLLYRPAAYSNVLRTDMAYLGAVGVFFGVRLIAVYLRGASALARQRVRVVTLGSVCGFSLPAFLVLGSAASGGGFAINLGVLPPIVFVISLAYALVKHDLFAMDAMVKRGAYYAVFTGAVGAAYIAAVALLNLFLKANSPAHSLVFPFLFTFAVLLIVNPLRSRLQAFVDRVFFRTAYDAAAVLATVSRALAGSLQRRQIADIVRDGIARTIPNVHTRLFVAEDGERLHEVGGDGRVAPALAAALADGRLVTAFDSVESYPDPQTHEAVHAGLAELAAEVGVPLQLRGALVGLLTAGAKRSGLFYTAGDAEFLRALAHQAAIALENARSYERLVDLNARLEDRVRERTAQLETANRELAEAYAELKNAEGQLVHAEKMASLGRLVAGVAHEINNPVSFISTSVPPLRRRLGQAAAIAPPPVQRALAEAEDIVGVMARGAERTAAIVRDLRTFSRLDEAVRKPVDLHECIDVTLRLLEPRWRGRITVHRDFASLPPVECDPSQLNQVFMNVIANACDAIAGPGNLWIATRVEDGHAIVTFRDDGPGIPADVRDRIFEPFFTTKDVGHGTGLGLAISHGIVTAHGGRLEVDGGTGAGATFRITLPLAAPPLARAAGAR